MAGGKGLVEYWHDAGPGPAGWRQAPAPAAKVRVPGVVHETSTLYMSDDLEKDKHASVDKQYKARGCGNVYVTGGALFPSSGSWNREYLLSLVQSGIYAEAF